MMMREQRKRLNPRDDFAREPRFARAARAHA